MSRKMPRAMLPLWRCKSTSFLSSEVNMSASINPKNIAMITYHFISLLINDDFDFEVSLANDVAIDVDKHAVITLPWSWHFNQWKQALHNEIKLFSNPYCTTMIIITIHVFIATLSSCVQLVFRILVVCIMVILKMFKYMVFVYFVKTRISNVLVYYSKQDEFVSKPEKLFLAIKVKVKATSSLSLVSFWKGIISWVCMQNMNISLKFKSHSES